MNALVRQARAIARPSTPYTARLLSSSRSPSAPQTSSAAANPAAPNTAPTLPSTPSTSSPVPPAQSTPTHYLVTLLRSPLHLSKSIGASLTSLGLYKRLSSSIVPINSVNAGYILKAKELVGVRTVSAEEVASMASKEWRNRPGDGRQGSGLRVREGAGEAAVIRVGSERARGDERGFRVVSKP
ncbi:hypothetical protein JCM21900_006907 [Sporobolomyces salmonicolor]